MTIEGSNFTVKSKELHGDYYRPLAPGKYTIVVRKQGFTTERAQIEVPDGTNGIIRNFVLRRRSGKSGGRVGVMDGKSAGEKSDDGDGKVEVFYEQKLHDGVLMVLIGGVVLNGLWITHKRLSGRFQFVRPRTL